jgi:hypothetical protein
VAERVAFEEFGSSASVFVVGCSVAHGFFLTPLLRCGCSLAVRVGLVVGVPPAVCGLSPPVAV